MGEKKGLGKSAKGIVRLRLADVKGERVPNDNHLRYRTERVEFGSTSSSGRVHIVGPPERDAGQVALAAGKRRRQKAVERFVGKT